MLFISPLIQLREHPVVDERVPPLGNYLCLQIMIEETLYSLRHPLKY